MYREIEITGEDILQKRHLLDLEEMPLMEIQKVMQTGKNTFEIIATDPKTNTTYKIFIKTLEIFNKSCTLKDILSAAWKHCEVDKVEPTIK